MAGQRLIVFDLFYPATVLAYITERMTNQGYIQVMHTLIRFSFKTVYFTETAQQLQAQEARSSMLVIHLSMLNIMADAICLLLKKGHMTGQKQVRDTRGLKRPRGANVCACVIVPKTPFWLSAIKQVQNSQNINYKCLKKQQLWGSEV